jgi:hypothetical protein
VSGRRGEGFTVIAKPLTQTALTGAICQPFAEHACPHILVDNTRETGTC